GPLAAFPERKFYPGRYVSAAPTQKLALCENWNADLDLVARSTLDPAFPVIVLVHNGPSSSTSNPFEASLAARLASTLFERVVDDRGEAVPSLRFWNDVAAVVSPHRAQNAAIRQALPEALRADAFVETVDRIQGKERDAIILSYCVADPEFALAEAEFIFSSERLNVATTRGRSKLVLILSKRLLEAVPTEQSLMDKAEVLREFVFSCEAVAETDLDGPAGRRVHVQIRARGFNDERAELDLTDEPPPADAAPTMTQELEGVLAAIRQVAAQGTSRSAALSKVKRALARKTEPFAEARMLHLLGWVSLEHRDGNWGTYWSAVPFDQQRRVYGIDIATVRSRIAVVVREAKSGRHAFYNRVRDRFAWMTANAEDALLPILRQLESEGVVETGMAGGSITVSVPQRAVAAGETESLEKLPPLSDADFELLNRLEDFEAARINFGVVETWTSTVELSRQAGRGTEAVTETLSRLEAHGHVMLAEDARVRSRLAELAREIRHVKQRFRSDDAHRRPYLVRSLKVEIKDRNKPTRNLPLRDVFARAAGEATAEQQTALAGLGQALQGLWGDNAALAAFQEKGLRSGLAAWRGDATATLAIAADTGSGKTEAACLPLIAGALADRLSGIKGVRALLAYPRIRLVANQAQRLANYLAACSALPDLPLLTLGLQVKDVPDSFADMHDRYAATWPLAGANAYRFPFFACPACGDAVVLRPGEGREGADALTCTKGDWRFDGWIGSKDQLRATPPALFLPTTDSLHQWLHDPRAGRLFGDDPDFAPPRVLLAD
ncbi:MAG: DEAD/DEAH box helicase, partial [Methylobacterium mesophilicum]|nr:DEAD/DEAH box helicase [Methylobacterium mesophilicum]